MSISNSQISVFKRCAESKAVDLIDFWNAAQESRKVRITGRHGTVRFELDGHSASTPRYAATVGGENKGGEDFTALSRNLLRALES